MFLSLLQGRGGNGFLRETKVAPAPSLHSRTSGPLSLEINGIIQDQDLGTSGFPAHICGSQKAHASDGEFLGLKPIAITHKYSLGRLICFNKQTSPETKTPFNCQGGGGELFLLLFFVFISQLMERNHTPTPLWGRTPPMSDGQAVTVESSMGGYGRNLEPGAGPGVGGVEEAGLAYR